VGASGVLLSARNNIHDAFNASGFGGKTENWFSDGTIDYPQDYQEILSWNIGFEYSLTNFWRLGVAQLLEDLR
jgi:hypothetical protein